MYNIHLMHKSTLFVQFLAFFWLFLQKFTLKTYFFIGLWLIFHKNTIPLHCKLKKTVC